jgi:hypothetical protein
VPAVTPVTTPPAEIVAVPVPAVIDHVPPGVEFVNAGVVEPVHTDVAPPPFAFTVGTALIVTEAVVLNAAHPPEAGIVYVTV